MEGRGPGAGTGAEEYERRPVEGDIVIHTRLHHDHSGDNRLFPNARLFAQRRELQYAFCFENIEHNIPVGHLYSRADWFASMQRAGQAAARILPSRDPLLFGKKPALFP